MKIYLSSTLNPEKRENMKAAVNILMDAGFDVYDPSEHIIEHAWEYPNNEWGLMVFQADIQAIQESDYVVVLSYGRESTAGTNWEAGYAFGIGKKIILVEMTDNVMSLLVANGRYATVSGLEGLKKYDWYKMPKIRTNTEQK